MVSGVCAGLSQECFIELRMRGGLRERALNIVGSEKVAAHAMSSLGFTVSDEVGDQLEHPRVSRIQTAFPSDELRERARGRLCYLPPAALIGVDPLVILFGFPVDVILHRVGPHPF